MSIKCATYPEDSKEFFWDENALKVFKKLITEKDIKCQMDDIFLLGFLRAKKYDMEQSLRLLKKYYFVRKNNPQIFKNLLPSKLEHVLSLNALQFLPHPDQKGRYMLIFQFGNWDTSVANVTEIFRALLLFLDFQLNFHRTQENGVIFIANVAGLTSSHVFQCFPKILNCMAAILFRDAYQLRIKAIHYVNINPILKAILSLFLPFFPIKMKRRIFLHNSVSTLHKFVYPKCLPVEFGGELPSIDPKETNKVIQENSEIFRMNEEYLYMFEENFSGFNIIQKDLEDKQFKQVLQDVEAKYNRYVKDPESYLTNIDQKPELDITVCN